MSTKTNLRFLLSLGSTKMVILQDEEDVHVYTNQRAPLSRHATVTAEHVAEALANK